MEHIDLDAERLAEMREADPNEPIVMLNLLRFREQALDGFGVDGMTGRQAFVRYGELNDQHDLRYGNEPIWMGAAHQTLIGDEGWDLAVLARYPTRQHFIDKVGDPAHQEVGKVRAAAVADSRLIELTQLLPAES